ncbi:MAG: protein kinase, partial [Planctomycetaceae bacterium]|nr:protein kinase [Planctomycetaceae bacterium]
MSDEAKIDEYELVNCIATGNATQIWEVRQGGQAFAMKLLLDEAFKDPEQKKSLKAEANLGKTFEHPHIIKIFQLVMNKKHGYFIMEHFRGNNMKSMIRHEHFVVQSKAQKVCEAMTQALGLIHEKGWVHRDVKPENILLN